ncbi:HAD-IIB family hydrolase [Leisingera thetidis]|uniref:HAD-IIB family hydrolase n=1 Tax=Leisingera thetidis TaxID=2930199 RepID=UPI0021F6AFCD|nr:HAD family hydrolase [Leisingera thetidis]
MPDLQISRKLPLDTRPKLFFCDVDRTLLTHDHKLLPTVSAAMRGLDAIDLPIILASARSPVGVERVHAEVGASDMVCCFNGAWIGNLRNRETLRENRLDRDFALEAMSVVHSAGGSPIWFDLTCGYVLTPDEQVARRRTDVTGDDLALIRSPEDAPGAPFKLLATFPAGRISDAVQSLSLTFANKLTVAQSGPNLVELVSPDTRKDLAAAFLADARAIAVGDVVVAGDSDNDLEMLRWAGLAITVANAKPHIQSAADIVAPSCDDGGLAIALEWLVQQVLQLSAEEVRAQA